MLLKALYDFAHSRKLLDDLAFAQKAIRWVIQLDAEGNLLGVLDTSEDGKRGKEFSAPFTSRPKVAGGVAEVILAQTQPAQRRTPSDDHDAIAEKTGRHGLRIESLCDLAQLDLVLALVELNLALLAHHREVVFVHRQRDRSVDIAARRGFLGRCLSAAGEASCCRGA